MTNRFQGLRDFLWALGGRKYVLTIGSVLINTALFAAAILSEPGYITLIMGSSGAYLAADGVQTWKEKSNAGQPNG